MRRTKLSRLVDSLCNFLRFPSANSQMLGYFWLSRKNYVCITYCRREKFWWSFYLLCNFRKVSLWLECSCHDSPFSLLLGSTPSTVKISKFFLCYYSSECNFMLSLIPDRTYEEFAWDLLMNSLKDLVHGSLSLKFLLIIEDANR